MDVRSLCGGCENVCENLMQTYCSCFCVGLECKENITFGRGGNYTYFRITPSERAYTSNILHTD